MLVGIYWNQNEITVNHLIMVGPIFVDYGCFCFVLFFAYLINFVNGKTQRFSVRTK